MSSPSAAAILGSVLSSVLVAGAVQAAVMVDNSPAIEAPATADAPTPVENLGGSRSLSRSQERPSRHDPATGVRTVDMLLDLHGTDDKGATTAVGAASRPEALRPRQAASATSALRGLANAPLEPSTEEGSAEAARGKRWNATNAAGGSPSTGTSDSGGEARTSEQGSGYRGDFDGVDLSRSPTRKLLLFLRQHRDWVIVCSVAAALAVLTLRASMLRRRRR